MFEANRVQQMPGNVEYGMSAKESHRPSVKPAPEHMRATASRSIKRGLLTSFGSHIVISYCSFQTGAIDLRCALLSVSLALLQILFILHFLHLEW